MCVPDCCYFYVHAVHFVGYYCIIYNIISIVINNKIHGMYIKIVDDQQTKINIIKNYKAKVIKNERRHIVQHNVQNKQFGAFVM